MFRKRQMRMMIVPVSFILSAHNSFGQTRQQLTWSTLQLPVQLTNNWQLHNDFSYRTIGLAIPAYQYTIRTGIRRFLPQKWNVATGLAFFYTRTSFEKANTEFGREFRLWQEANKEYKLNKKLIVGNRLRTEERFFAATSKKPEFVALRLRYRIAFVQAIGEKWKFQLANEYMQQASAGKFSFQQNRISTTAIYVVNTSTQLQAGYLRADLKSGIQHFITCTYSKTIYCYGHQHKG